MSSTRQYNAAESWCNLVIQNADQLLFDVKLFDLEMKKAATELGFPLEVMFY